MVVSFWGKGDSENLVTSPNCQQSIFIFCSYVQYTTRRESLEITWEDTCTSAMASIICEYSVRIVYYVRVLMKAQI